ncbi:glutamyl-tRNA synthetase, archaeal and eukaryotic family [Caldisphaera lagunensis DSM 15908]|uniref:Glutamate--tRNA ligase n=1 Tax=Caldisphaera lagunensis (strain DSM 15908 / JCM 11604 / ANMR 0165 / IC-154) TaxID=1056495 RepID=L0AAJ2_CALLD|nr:glutamate--tRNA ligase [Caldisphaera lagunensis]AFZ70060.1 glutamyl-tRNA synthetase, archaeal and eukaryotic family [Caldisphaera lagunensis DSM 15908]
MSEELESLVWKYTLLNAIEHNGKAQTNSVMSMILGERSDLRQKAKEISKLVSLYIEKVNKMSLEEQKKEIESLGLKIESKKKEKIEEKTLPPLPNAEIGKVVTRFAPNPDFVIHIGNARPAILSYEYAKMYNGKMILRFEDTDPRTKTPIKEAYDLIREDLKWLGVKPDEEYIQSKRLDIFYEVAKEMIKKGCAYVDKSGDEGKKLLSNGIAPPNRKSSPEENMEEFEKMLGNYYKEGEAVLRIKTDVNHPNPSIRDWIAFRIIDTSSHPHPIVGDKYVLWPTYNFAVSVDDHLLGITHVLRGKEHELNTMKQEYVYKCMNWNMPNYIHFGRLKLEGFIMSKSYIRKIMSENPGNFLGYDDPRFGTISGLRRRGILPESIKEVILEVGIKIGDAKLSWTNLASVNRKKLDPMADRLMFVANPVKITVEQPSCIEAKIPLHPDKPEKYRIIKVCNGDEVYIDENDLKLKRFRLMELGNYEHKDGVLKFVSKDIQDARKEKLQIIHWVLAKDSKKMLIREPEGLQFKDYNGVVENYIINYNKNARLQFLRFGFIIIDSIDPLVGFLTHK